MRRPQWQTKASIFTMHPNSSSTRFVGTSSLRAPGTGVRHWSASAGRNTAYSHYRENVAETPGPGQARARTVGELIELGEHLAKGFIAQLAREELVASG